jgi:hypothetical protein
VNESHCRIFGKSAGDPVGHRMWGRIPVEEHGALRRHFSELAYG